MSTSPTLSPLPLTRKTFYELSIELKEWASDLARLDPLRVNLAECRRFNGRLAQLRRYELLGVRLAGMRPARPIARLHVATLSVVVWAILLLTLLGRSERVVQLLLLNSAGLTVLAVWLIPESLFGTTVEGLEGKLLRVVTVLEEMLAGNELHFTEGAFWTARGNLTAARLELRQQLDLAHREG